VKVKIEVDGAVVFEHPGLLDEVGSGEQLEVGVHAAKYDLEEYRLPPVIRKALKTSKLGEVFQVRSTRRDKALPYFNDDEGQVFKKDLLEPFTQEVVFTVVLVAFEQKDYLFKLLIADKLERL
jgi:hypothetical protein